MPAVSSSLEEADVLNDGEGRGTDCRRLELPSTYCIHGSSVVEGQPSDHLDAGHVASFVDPHVKDDGSRGVVAVLERPVGLDPRPDRGWHDRAPDSSGWPRDAVVWVGRDGDKLYDHEPDQNAKQMSRHIGL
jgi:hypothetical protein